MNKKSFWPWLVATLLLALLVWHETAHPLFGQSFFGHVIVLWLAVAVPAGFLWLQANDRPATHQKAVSKRSKLTIAGITLGTVLYGILWVMVAQQLRPAPVPAVMWAAIVVPTCIALFYGQYLILRDRKSRSTPVIGLRFLEFCLVACAALIAVYFYSWALLAVLIVA